MRCSRFRLVHKPFPSGHAQKNIRQTPIVPSGRRRYVAVKNIRWTRYHSDVASDLSSILFVTEHPDSVLRELKVHALDALNGGFMGHALVSCRLRSTIELKER